MQENDNALQINELLEKLETINNDITVMLFTIILILFLFSIKIGYDIVKGD